MRDATRHCDPEGSSTLNQPSVRECLIKHSRLSTKPIISSSIHLCRGAPGIDLHPLHVDLNRPDWAH